MAGFKQTLINLDPICLLSFDSMKLSDNNLTYKDNKVLDEMDNFVGDVISESTKDIAPSVYSATGLAPNDIYEQQSIRFCPIGMQDENVRRGESTLFPKAYVRAKTVNLGQIWNTGKEMTYVFQIFRDYQMLRWMYPIYDPITNKKIRDIEYYTYKDPILTHTGILSISETLNRYGLYWNKIEFNFDWLVGWRTRKIEIRSVDLFGRDNALANLIIVRVSDSKIDIFRNLDLIYSTDDQYYQLYRDTRSGAITESKVDTALLSSNPKWRTENELFIGGLPGKTDGEFSDRCCIPTTIDNVALFNYALNDTQITQLYRRMFSLDDMILKTKPIYYIPCDDFSNSGKKLINYGTRAPYISFDKYNPPILIAGDVSKVGYRNPGPISLRSSILFNGYQYIKHKDGAIFNPINDFSTYFQFKYVDGIRSCLLYQGTDTPFYGGVSIWVNSKDGQQKYGSIEVIFPGNTSIILTETAVTDKWYSIALIQCNGYIYTWFNSKRIEFGKKLNIFPTVEGLRPSNGYMLTSPFQQHLTKAYLSDICFWDKAISPLYMEGINEYERVYYIRGTVMYEGAPYQAKIRAYNHRTGEFINEVLSDKYEGHYLIPLKTDEPVDIICIDDRDIMTKVKAYGPIVPYTKPFDVYSI